MIKATFTHTLAKLFFVFTLAAGLILGLVLSLGLAPVVQAAAPPGDSEVTVRTNGIDDDFNSMSLIGALSVITVSTTDDELNSDGDCSLREAIQSANTDTAVDNCTPGSGADIITFIVTGTYILTGTAGEDNNVSGDLDITSTLIISGAGASSTIINGGGKDRVLHIISGSVEINSVTITNGRAPDGSVAESSGGAILNSGVLTINNSVISSNFAGNGGSNQNGGDGGGISNNGPLTIISSTISNNASGNGVSSNTNGGLGGGVANSDALTITNSTVSGNSTGTKGISGMGGEGGGISNNGTLVMTNSTVASNSTSSGGSGGGLFLAGGSSTGIKNSIIANNATGFLSPDCSGSFNSQGYNLIGDSTNCTITEVANPGTNLTGVSAQFFPLTNNGGETDTHALQATSPAIDAGSCPNVTTDQRGKLRPIDTPLVPANADDGCDIGSYEAQPELALAKTSSSLQPDKGDPITYTIVITNGGVLSATNAAISDTLDSNLTFAGPVSIDPTQTITADTSALPVLTISGLTISPGLRITITFPVTVTESVAGGTTITNTAGLSSAEIITPVMPGTDGVSIITVGLTENYLPIIIKNS